jgi:hypothetical protein
MRRSIAYRVLVTGTEFTPEDGEREFRIAVWRDVIAKEQIRINGMPLRRKQVFVNIAVRRAKQMVYGVPSAEFDSDTVLKLEEDNLVRRDPKNNLVSPAHDVLEDWALEQYMEDAYQQHSSNLQGFLDSIGSEPAMNRAFRLWLHQKLRYGDNVNDLVLSVINDQNIQRYWQDETISAILLGDNPDEFLELLKDQLFINDGELLKRFCFLLRIACQAPDTISTKSKDTGERTLVDTLFLKPYGNGWKAVICFLFDNKDLIIEGLLPHVTAVLSDWASAIHIDKELPIPSREAGLLALHLLNYLKESYRDEKDRKKILSIIIQTASVIHAEFTELLEKDVFISKSSRQDRRLRYVDDLCEIAFSLIESAFLSKHYPDILIRLAHLEWYFDASDEDNEPWYRRTNIEVAECFGLHEYRHEFFPASGAKGPFRNLLYYHPRKGLDFILDLLNTTAEKYAHSDLDYPKESSTLKIAYSEPLIEQIEIHLNDGSSIKQYCTGRLWGAYRGQSVIPYLLQSALMALENWLIAYVKQFETDSIVWLFDYILRKSNSVMPTAVLASIATGFPEKIGKSALPLLRTFELYFLDSARMFQEQVGWIGGGFQRGLFSEIYAEERRTAALHPWRKEDLETLIKRFQFLGLRDEALAAIDILRALVPHNEKMRFLLHRIDSRGWKPVEDKENRRIIFEPVEIEDDLKEISQKTQDMVRKNNRFSSLFVWAGKVFDRESLEHDYYVTWNDALAEAKALLEELKSGAVKDLSSMYYGGIVTATAVFIRDHSNELTEEDILWCAELIIPTASANADTDNSLAMADATDHDGAAAASSVLPILLDFVSSKKEKLLVKRLIATGLTHVNEKVRNSAAAGIREHLWQRDPEFAQNCVNGAIEYARFEKNSEVKRWRGAYFESDKKDVELSKLKAKKVKFRERIAQGKFSNTLGVISLRTHSSWHILAPCLMIPDGSRNPSHIDLLSQMLTLFFEAENNKHRDRSGKDENLEINYEASLDFTKRFAKYLFSLQETDFEDYIEQLKAGCDAAPDFIKYLVLCVAVEAEKAKQKEVYWKLWQQLSTKVQEIAIEIAQHSSGKRHFDADRSKLIRGFLHSDIDWQKIDLGNQEIAAGKDVILEFVTNAGKNADVFEALAKLMHYFPSIFFELGVQILAKHQKEEGGIRLISGINTAFYLERSIQRYLQLNQTGSLPRNMHESCFVLLDAIVETASSRAYYLREHLIRSRRIL